MPEQPVDYWTFVDHVARTLPEAAPDADVEANQLILSLNRASALVTRHLEATVHRPRGHSWATYRLLFVTWLHGPLTPLHLANLSGMTKAGVSNLTGPMVERGLLERRAAEHDGRSRVLALTDAGRDYITEVFEAESAAEVAWAESLTPIERTLLIALLSKLNSSDHARAARRPL